MLLNQRPVSLKDWLNIWALKCMSETEPAITITFQPFVKAKEKPLPNGFLYRSCWGFCHVVDGAAAVPYPQAFMHGPGGWKDSVHGSLSKVPLPKRDRRAGWVHDMNWLAKRTAKPQNRMEGRRGALLPDVGLCLSISRTSCYTSSAISADCFFRTSSVVQFTVLVGKARNL